MLKQKSNHKNNQGFTLIELLVVVAIIALLTSIALIAFLSAREKSRDAKRLSDMTQMNTGMELYYANYGGYPDDVDNNGQPDALAPKFTTMIPANPMPVDGDCPTDFYANGQLATRYYYIPTGTQASILIDGAPAKVWSSYYYYFCLGGATGNFPAGVHTMTPHGVQ